jgi:thioredoxin-like negative regulator of GroEL
MAVTALKGNQIECTVEENNIVLLDFWSPSCPPCVGFADTFEEASRRYPGISFCRVNIDEEPEAARAFEIESIPTLVLYRERIMVGFKPGMLPPEVLDRMIRKTLSLDMNTVRKMIAEKTGEEAS